MYTGVESKLSVSHTQRQAESISHEFLHKLLFELENKETSKQLDNISKSANNETYIL